MDPRATNVVVSTAIHAAMLRAGMSIRLQRTSAGLTGRSVTGAIETHHRKDFPGQV